MKAEADAIRATIRDSVRRYYDAAFPAREFVPGETPVLYGGRVFDAEELEVLVESSLDFWLTSGPYTRRFEEKFAAFFGQKYAMLVNSGSSANLLALTALTAPELRERRLRPGDEVMTTATGFPTTLNPILQNALTPVFLDISIPNYNVDVDQLEQALSEKTKAVILAHTLGNPFNLDVVTSFAKDHNLWLIEDCCDAVGSKYRGRGVGTFGDLATVSFYPAHHMTMGEGGCVLTQDPLLKKIIESLRDWGRDCWCPPGRDNTCGKRFERQMGELPEGYDHKYTYSHIGYNLKATDMQAAIGTAQLQKLPGFIEARKANFKRLLQGLKDLSDVFILPKATEGSDPSWFGFPLAVRQEAPFERSDVLEFMEERKIATRLLFGGNLVRQPAYLDAPKRVVGTLDNSDFVMNNVFWIGVYPGLTEEMLGYVVRSVHDCAGGASKKATT